MQWGPGKASKACNSKCPSNYIALTKNPHIAGKDGGCKSDRYAPVCCDFVVAYSGSGDTCQADYTAAARSTICTPAKSTIWSTVDNTEIPIHPI